MRTEIKNAIELLESEGYFIDKNLYNTATIQRLTNCSEDEAIGSRDYVLRCGHAPTFNIVWDKMIEVAIRYKKENEETHK